jgi:hypothetical protein
VPALFAAARQAKAIWPVCSQGVDAPLRPRAKQASGSGAIGRSGTSRQEYLNLRGIRGYRRLSALTGRDRVRQKAPANTQVLMRTFGTERLDRTQEVAGSSPASSTELVGAQTDGSMTR